MFCVGPCDDAAMDLTLWNPLWRDIAYIREL